MTEFWRCFISLLSIPVRIVRQTIQSFRRPNSSRNFEPETKPIVNYMSDICIHLELDTYLRQWFIHDSCGEPVRLMRASIESKILETFLIEPPHNAVPDLPRENTVAIVIPMFRHKDSRRHNYLPQKAKDALKETIRNRFDIELFNDLHTFGRIGKRLDGVIYAWMEAHGIEINETNWNAIAKRYQRLRRQYLDRERKQNKKKSRKKF